MINKSFSPKFQGVTFRPWVVRKVEGDILIILHIVPTLRGYYKHLSSITKIRKGDRKRLNKGAIKEELLIT